MKILDACCGSRMFWFDREQNKKPIEMGQWVRELKAGGLEVIDRKSLLNEHCEQYVEG